MLAGAVARLLSGRGDCTHSQSFQHRVKGLLVVDKLLDVRQERLPLVSLMHPLLEFKHTYPSLIQRICMDSVAP